MHGQTACFFSNEQSNLSVYLITRPKRQGWLSSRCVIIGHHCHCAGSQVGGATNAVLRDATWEKATTIIIVCVVWTEFIFPAPAIAVVLASERTHSVTVDWYTNKRRNSLIVLENDLVGRSEIYLARLSRRLAYHRIECQFCRQEDIHGQYHQFCLVQSCR
jgi:hypothetical protein